MSVRQHTFTALILLTCGLQQAGAHPHLWITAKAELLFDGENNFTAIRHQWEFDEPFTAYATQGLDKNGDGKFSRHELAKLAQINVESVADYQYFTFTKMNGNDVEYSPGTDYWLEYQNGQLTLFFTLPLATPIKPDPDTRFEDLTIRVFDPLFFAAVEFPKENPITLYGPGDGETGCDAVVALPQEMDPTKTRLLANIGPDEEIPDDLSPDIAYLANTIKVSCPTL